MGLLLAKMIQPTFQVNDRDFDRRLAEFSHVFRKDIIDVFKQWGRILGKELVDRTPPFSGKQLEQMLKGRPLNSKGSQPMLSEDIGNLSDRQVGERRVDKDIKRLIFGLKKDEEVAAKRAASVFAKKLRKRSKELSFKTVELKGRVQKCAGTIAAKLFATSSGTVYGVDLTKYVPNATIEQIKETHYRQRTKHGRVTSAGSSTRDVGRWKFLDMLVTKERIRDRYIRIKQKMVGEAKGGWVAGIRALGGRASPWIKRHENAGACINKLSGDRPSFTFINKSRWASANDPNKIIAKSMAGVARSMASQIRMKITGNWKKRVKKQAA